MAGHPFWARTTMSCWRLSAWQCLRNAMEDVQLCLGEATVWDTFWGGFKMCGLNLVSGSFIWFYVFLCYVVLWCFVLFYDVLCCFYVVLCQFHLQVSKGTAMLNKKQRVSQHWSLWYAEMHTVFPLLNFVPGGARIIPPLQLFSFCPRSMASMIWDVLNKQ